jgi:antitoxin (DNA-binding transcriptional repressor) of toxin-antitoxin stability system
LMPRCGRRQAYVAYLQIRTCGTISGMEVTITQFRQKVFELVDQALEGKEVWVKHKGKRVRIVPEHPVDKLSRITPMEIIVPGADLEDDSWKIAMMREWDQKWDRLLRPVSKPARAANGSGLKKPRKARRTA